MSTVAHQARRGYRTLRLPLSEADYEQFMNEGAFAKAQLDELYERHPELFPAGFDPVYAPETVNTDGWAATQGGVEGVISHYC